MIRRWTVSYDAPFAQTSPAGVVQCLTESDYSTTAEFARMIALPKGRFDTDIDVKRAAPAEPFPAMIFGERETVIGIEFDRDGFIWVRVLDDSHAGYGYRRVTREEWRAAEWSVID